MIRLIGYVDMNAYFASIEQQTNPSLRGKPIAVGGRPGTRSIITTASYEARALGVKTAMSVNEALTICPTLTIVPPDYSKYQDYTRRLTLLASQFSPSVELCSIDEFAIDLTHLVDESDISGSCHRLQNFIVEFKAVMKHEFGRFVTASIGLGTSPTHAKIAGDLRKPNGCYFIAPNINWARHAVTNGLPARTWSHVRRDLKLEDIPGIGRKLGPTLRLSGYSNIDSLAQADEGELIFKFGILGVWLSRVAQGKMTHAIHSFHAQAAEQSMSHQTTLPRDLPLAKTRAVFFTLADRVGNRMHRADLIAKAFFVGFGRTHESGWYRRVRIHQPISNGLDLFRLGWNLTQKAWKDQDLVIRRPTIGVTNLIPKNSYPPSFLPEDEKSERMHAMVHLLRSQYGDSIIQAATSNAAHVDHIPDGRRVRFDSLA